MKYCTQCGHVNADEAKFCGGCGKEIIIVYNTQSEQAHTNTQSDEQEQSYEGVTTERSGYSAFVDRLNEYVGNDRPVDLNWKILFTDVFKDHSTDEAEEIFICGTKDTTPTVSQVSKTCPRPWLYSRVFLMFTIAFALLWVCCSMFGNENAVPGLIVVGSFAVPLSTMILFLEVNAWRNVSLYKVLQTFLVGGCASLVATLILFSIVGSHELDYFGALMVGVVEELGKVVIVYYFLRRLGKLSILSGLLIGASVGAGFAAFESAGYAMRLLFQEGWDTMMNVIFLRGFLAPGGHVTWAAISGVALVIAAKARGQVSTGLFGDGKFLRLFILPIAMHAAWDSPLSAIGSEFYLVPIGLTVLVWIIVLILINMGLAEINYSK